jgi:hypothetical protein
MKTNGWLMAAALLAGACHPHTVATPATDRDARAQAQKSPSGPKRPKPEAAAKTDDDKAKPRDEGTADTPIPRNPAAALEHGQLKEIQRRLAQRKLLGEHEEGNLDEPTRVALRRLQKAEDLPETGLPDHETVRKLGLDPDQVFAKRREEPGSSH